jgi:hypothetical protein
LQGQGVLQVFVGSFGKRVMITYNRFLTPEQVKRVCPGVKASTEDINEVISYFALLDTAAILVRIRARKQENEALDKIQALWDNFRESVEAGEHDEAI